MGSSAGCRSALHFRVVRFCSVLLTTVITTSKSIKSSLLVCCDMLITTLTHDCARPIIPPGTTQTLHTPSNTACTVHQRVRPKDNNPSKKNKGPKKPPIACDWDRANSEPFSTFPPHFADWRMAAGEPRSTPFGLKPKQCRRSL